MRTSTKSLFFTVLGCLAISHVLTVASATAESSSKTYEVVIVGGGIAGLAAAFYLEDYDLLVLEKEGQAGGRAASGEYLGIPFARGPEYLGMPEEPLEEIIKTLHLDLREIPAPADVLFRGGQFYFGDYGRARLLADASSPEEFRRFADKTLSAYSNYDDIPYLTLRGEQKRLDNITARQWFEENRFSPVYGEIYNVSFRGLFGANSDEISALSALPELAFDFEGIDAAPDNEDLMEELKADNNSSGMYSFDKGLAQIPIALGRYLGNRLQTGTTVTGIRRVDELFEILSTRGGKEITYRAESVIIATPAPIAVDIAAGALSEEQRKILGTVSYAPYITIAFFSEKPIFNQGFDLAVPDGFIFTDVYDATWMARYNNDKAKFQNWVTLVYAAPASYRDTTLLAMSDKDLVDTVLTQLDLILPGSSGLVKNWEITRFRYGYPVMTPGAFQRITMLHSITGEGLYLAGDYMVYPTFEAAAMSGHLAAQQVMDWLEE